MLGGLVGILMREGFAIVSVVFKQTHYCMLGSLVNVRLEGKKSE